MCCFTSWNVLSGVCEGFSPNAAIYFCALNVTRRRKNEASIPKWGWGRTLADIDTTVCAFHFRMYSQASVITMTCVIYSVVETISLNCPSAT